MPEQTIVAHLPSAALNKRKEFLVMDSLTPGDCTIGGGTARTVCVSNGVTWESMETYGTAAALNTPIPMSALSAPLKAQSDALTATGFATAAQGTRADSALQNASVFASSSQGSKADSALQAVPLASTSTNGLMLAADYTNLQTVVSAVQFYRRAVIVKDGISVATANSDTLIITGLPTKYLITRLSVYNASSALSTVSGGLYTGAGGSGVIIGPSVITAANSTSFFDFPSLVLTTRTNALLYFRITVPKSATTVSVLLELLNLG